MRKKKMRDNEAITFITLPDRKEKKVNAKGVPAYSERELYSSLEERMESLKPHGKKGRRNKILQIALLVFCCVMSIFLLRGLSAGSGEAGSVTVGQLFADMRLGYALAALAGVLFFIIVESFFFSYLCRITTGRFRPFISFKTAMLGKYYDNITPLGAGGQPFQMVYLNKNDVPIGVATSLPLIKYFTWVFVNVPLCILLMIINNHALDSLSIEAATTMRVAAWLGVALTAIVPIFVIFFTALPKFGEKVVGGLLTLGSKIRFGKHRLVKDYDKSYAKAVKTVADFKSSMAYVSRRFLYVLVCVLLMIVSIWISNTIPYFVLLAVAKDIQPSWQLYYDIVTLCVISNLAASFIPTPGASGAAEGSFYIVFQGVNNLTAGLLFWVVLIWRILTYYLFLLIGLVMVAYDFVKNSVKEKFINRKKLAKTREKLVPLLESDLREERLASVRMLKSVDREDRFFAPPHRPLDEKLLLKTDCSSADFTPAELAYACYLSGSETVGLADTCTLAGAAEFSEACAALGLRCLVGVEVPCYLSRVRKQHLRINGVFQDDVVNLVMTGIPAGQWERVDGWLARKRELRNKRNRRMVELLNERVGKAGVSLSFEQVLAKSRADEGGTVTERHILEALGGALVERFGRGASLLSALRRNFGITVPEKFKKHLMDVVGNRNYMGDLAAVLRAEVPSFYVDAEEELCSILELMRIAEEVGAVVVYPYMGDVEQMVFGELRVQKYEDAFFFELLSELARLGVRGVTYCRSRHSPEQVERVREFAEKLGLLRFSGETLYDRRQTRELEELDPEADRDAIRNAAALLASSHAAAANPDEALFSLAAADKIPDLEQRLDYYAARAE